MTTITRADVEAAEKAAQRSVCDIPDGDLPDELAEALERRVEVSLTAAEASGVLRRLGGANEQVRRLEAPWSKRQAGPEAKAQQYPAAKKAAPKSRGRSAKKANSTKAAASNPVKGSEEGTS